MGNLENSWGKQGVAALIVNPQSNTVLTIEERNTKRATNKIAGMRSIPMETRESNEPLRVTRRRLFIEEVRIQDLDYIRPAKTIGVFELSPGTGVYFYAYEIAGNPQILNGEDLNDVQNIGWTQIEDLINEPVGNLRFRPGNREGLIKYLDYKINPRYFRPEIIRFNQLLDSIPSNVFDLIENGLSVEEALSQLGLRAGVPRLPLSFARLQS
jgi:hypothetical protein